MAFLHSRGRAHNDLKSLNLFVSEHGIVKVIGVVVERKTGMRSSEPLHNIFLYRCAVVSPVETEATFLF